MGLQRRVPERKAPTQDRSEQSRVEGPAAGDHEVSAAPPTQRPTDRGGGVQQAHAPAEPGGRLSPPRLGTEHGSCRVRVIEGRHHPPDADLLRPGGSRRAHHAEPVVGTPDAEQPEIGGALIPPGGADDGHGREIACRCGDARRGQFLQRVEPDPTSLDRPVGGPHPHLAAKALEGRSSWRVHLDTGNRQGFRLEGDDHQTIRGDRDRRVHGHEADPLDADPMWPRPYRGQGNAPVGAGQSPQAVTQDHRRPSHRKVVGDFHDGDRDGLLCPGRARAQDRPRENGHDERAVPDLTRVMQRGHGETGSVGSAGQCAS